MKRPTTLTLLIAPLLLFAATAPASGVQTPKPLSPEAAYAYYKTAYTNTEGLLKSVPFTSSEKVYGENGRYQGGRTLTVDRAGNSSYADSGTGTTIRRGAYQYISVNSYELYQNRELVLSLANSKRAKYLRAPINAAVVEESEHLSVYAVDALGADISSMTAGEVLLTTTSTGSVLSWPARGDSKVWEGTYQVTIKEGLIIDSRFLSTKKKTIFSFTYKLNPSSVRAPSGPYLEWSSVAAKFIAPEDSN